MSFALSALKGLGRLLRGLLVFVLLAVSWTGALYVLYPWSSADSANWPDRSPIAATSGTTGNTYVIPFRKFREEAKTDPSLVPWPSTRSGSAQEGGKHSTWKAVGGKPWQFEVAYSERDVVRESRYRLDGEKPVLVESRVRGPNIAFQGAILAVVTMIVLRMGKWWLRRRAATRS